MPRAPRRLASDFPGVVEEGDARVDRFMNDANGFFDGFDRAEMVPTEPRDGNHVGVEAKRTDLNRLVLRRARLPLRFGMTSERAGRAPLFMARMDQVSVRLITAGFVGLSRGFEQFERVAVRIFDLNLSSAWTHFHVVSEGDAGSLQRGDAGREIGNAQHDTIPSAGFLTLTVRHRSRA